MAGLADLMRLAGRIDDNDANSDQPYKPTAEAQAMELRERFGRLMQTHDFQPGDIVRCKAGIGPHKPELNVRCIVLRKLDHADPFDIALVRQWVREEQFGNVTLKPDLVVGTLHGTRGNQVSCDLMASARLEPAGV